MPGPLIASAGIAKAAGAGKVAASAGMGKTLTGSIGAGLGKLANSQFGKSFDTSLAQGSAQSISGMLQEQGGKLLGIPTQDEKLKNTMDKLYPGTNPWERLGGVGSGVASGALASQVNREQQRNQQTLANKNIKKDLEVAKIQAGATVQAARETAAPGRERVSSEQERNRAQAEKQLAERKAILEKLPYEIRNLTERKRQIVANTMESFWRSRSQETISDMQLKLQQAGIREKELGYLKALGTIFSDTDTETSYNAKVAAAALWALSHGVGAVGAFKFAKFAAGAMGKNQSSIKRLFKYFSKEKQSKLIKVKPGERHRGDMSYGKRYP